MEGKWSFLLLSATFAFGIYYLETLSNLKSNKHQCLTLGYWPVVEQKRYDWYMSERRV